MIAGRHEILHVRVESIEGGRKALVRDSYGRPHTIPVYPMRTGRMPRRGEQWIMDQTLGRWTFAACMVEVEGDDPVYVSRPPTQQVFTADGTWTKPEGLSYVKVLAIGRGGHGGGWTGAAGNPTWLTLGSGGGAGGVALVTIPADDLGETETVTADDYASLGGAVSASPGLDGGVSFVSLPQPAPVRVTGGLPGEQDAPVAGVRIPSEPGSDGWWNHLLAYGNAGLGGKPAIPRSYDQVTNAGLGGEGIILDHTDLAHTASPGGMALLVVDEFY